MKNVVVAFGALWFMAGCDSPNVQPKTTPQTAAMNEDEETSSSRSSVVGFEMSMFEPGATRGELRRITFRIRAGSADIFDELNVYSLRDISATAYSESGEEIVFEAKRADFGEAEEEAHLEGDVHIRVGVFDLTMQRVDWNNKERTATTDSPVTIERGETRLIAAGGMTIDSRSQGVLFKDLSGRFAFGKEKS